MMIKVEAIVREEKFEDVKAALSGMLAPEIKEVELGQPDPQLCIHALYAGQGSPHRL